MLKFLFAAAAMALPATALHAQNMPLTTFLSKADALEKKGPLALLSSDMGLLKKEVTNSAGVLRTERLAAAKAGRRPTYCPPAKGAPIGSKELLGHFRSIPPAQRNINVKTALSGYFAKRFPCPA